MTNRDVVIWDKPGWMSRTQYRLLEALACCDELEILSPAVLAKNLDYSRAHVSRELADLVARERVERVADGYYRITDAGREHIDS